VDLRPRSQQNTVRPEAFGELVPVRVFGSRQLRVRRISSVYLGEAAPAPGQPPRRPRDVNGDGHLDRVFVFRQGDTRMMCIDGRVKVTGRTSDAKRFQDRVPITPTGCAT
jgi:hypothetical protein